jgi:NADPH-dependent 7-cyano-7-deazaguanine reductase|nr:MAG TPA: 7-cyano-7-deazaguanine reductase [Caudoviricetes sp.]
MNKNDQITEIVRRSLGDSTSYAVYSTEWDASLLNPIPRHLLREANGVPIELPGLDIWHCWEASFLLPSGKPQAGIVKIIIDANSPMMIESKSMKLFFNSFDMATMKSKDHYIETLKQCLSDSTKSDVQVAFFDAEEVDCIGSPLWDLDSLDVSGFEYNREHDHVKKAVANELYRFNAFRSRCRHTKQKDTATVDIQGRFKADSLLKELVSYREHNEFHELCADMLYHKLHSIDNYCSVYMFFNRRGSLDINPIRFKSHPNLQYDMFASIDHMMKGSMAQ